MNEKEQKAFEIYLESASYENDFKPLSEEAISAKLKELGIEASSSTINRWKAKFGWADALKNKITLAMSDNKEVKNLIAKSSLETAIKNTKVDIERNDILIAASYEILEFEAKRIKQKQNDGKLLNKDDIDIAKFIAGLTTGRREKMLDRMASAPREAVSADEILDRFKDIKLEIEDDSIEAEVIDDKASSD